MKLYRLAICLVGLTCPFVLSCSEQAKYSESTKDFDNQEISSRVIYGKDDRKDVYQIKNQTLLQLADATVALIRPGNLNQKSNGDFQIKGNHFGSTYNLCKSEPFREQEVAAYCSGFLVGDDLVVSAGHCLRNQKACENTKFVFNFAVKQEKSLPKTAKKNDVYNCKKLIHSEVIFKGSDFSVVKLDRKVTNHQPLQIRRAGTVKKDQKLVVIGYPSGLPTKIAGNASVRTLDSDFFVANLDTYGGNSGSAVFNAQSGLVEGILVRGETDFTSKDGCRVSKVCTNSGCRGEDVTKIRQAKSHIPKLSRGPASDEIFQSKKVQIIPDNYRLGITSEIIAASAPLGRRVRLALNIEHSWIGDLVILLESPSGKIQKVQSRMGSSMQQLVQHYDIHLSNEKTTGRWKLHIFDMAPFDQGTLINWQLNFLSN